MRTREDAANLLTDVADVLDGLNEEQARRVLAAPDAAGDLAGALAVRAGLGVQGSGSVAAAAEVLAGPRGAGRRLVTGLRVTGRGGLVLGHGSLLRC